MMSRCELVFIKRVPDPSIDLLSSLSQDPARAEKTAASRCRPMIGKREIRSSNFFLAHHSDRPHQYQTLNSLGIVERDRGGDAPP